MSDEFQDDISDSDARSEKSSSNIGSSKTTPTKCGGGSSRRKQLAPRFRLIRQCNECDFSTSNINEFKNHMNIEHSIEKVFPCDSCRHYCVSLHDFHLHAKSHEIKPVISTNSPLIIQSSSSITTPKTMTNFSKSILNSEEEITDQEQPTNYVMDSSFYNHQHNNNSNNNIEHETSMYDNEGCYDEESSDDEQGEDTQNRSSTYKKLNLSVTSSHSQCDENNLYSISTTTTQHSTNPDNDGRSPSKRANTTTSNDRKRPYNVSVDPARYRRVPDPDDANSVKFACSLCGNLYKWRKSLNKHWKEKHFSESPPPLDAPVHIRPTKTVTTATTTPPSSSSSSSPYNKSLQGRSRPSLDINFPPSSEKLSALSNMLSQPSKTLGLLGAPQSISGQSSVQPHHPAFPFHPFHQWLNPAWKPILATAHQNRFLSPQSLPQIPLPSDLSQFHQRNISSVQQQQKQNIYMPPSNKLILPPSEFSPSSDFATLRKHNERKQEYENDTKSFKGSNDNEPQKNEFDGSTGPLDLTVKTEKYDRVDNKPIMANISSRHSSNEPDKAIKKDKHRIKSKKHHSRAINTIKIEDNERNSSFEQHKHHQYSPGKQQHQSGSRSSSTEQLPEEQEDDHQQHTPITDISVSDHSRESFYDHPSRSQLKTTSSNRSSKAAASTTDISALSQQRHFNQHHQNDRSQSPQPIDSQQSSSRLSSANSNSQTDPTSPSQSLSHIPSIANPYGQKIFICSVCEQHFLSVETINDHFTQNHLPELEREISGKSPPRNTNVAQQNEEWNLSDPTNPLKCIQCDFVGRWPTELQKHAASHSSSRPFKCLICSLTYKWRWDLAKHFDRAHPKLVNPYKKRDRDQARSLMEQTKKGDDRNRRSTGTSSSPSSTTSSKKSISSRKLIPAPIVKQRRSTSSQLNDNEQLFEDLVDKTEISITDSDNEVEQEDRKTKSDDLDLEKENDDDDEDSLASPPTKRIKNKSNSDNHVTRSVSPPVMIDQPLPPSSLHPSFPYMPMTSASHPIYFPPPFYTGFPHSIFPSIPFMNPSLLLQSRELQKLHNMPNFPTSSLTSSSLSTSNENPPVSPSSASPSNLSKNRSSISNAAPFQLFSQNQRQQSPLSSSSPTPSSNATTPRSENNSNSNVTAQQHADNQFILNQAKHHRFAIAAMQAAAAAAAHQQQQQQPQTNGSNGQVSAISGNLTQFRQRKVEKEDRNFQCRWCDYRGRWRSELIQHMRCHHAQLKPYHCSACPYASNWKWDVQKHVKKQHSQDPAKIIEIPDKFLFRTTGTDLKQSFNPKNVTDEKDQQSKNDEEVDCSYFGVDVQQKLTTMKYTADRQLSCQQCPFAANSMAELRRHLIVHSSEQPYHCFNCDYRSKWKCDVKKHMRVCGHHGPVLVGRKAMQKVMESLGLVIGNTDKQQQAAAAAAAAVMMQMTKLNEQLQHHDLNEQEDNLEYTASEDEEDDDLVTGDHSKREWDETDTNNVSPPSIATDNSRTINEDRDESTAAAAISVNSQKKKHMKFPSSTSQTISNSNLRCRQCDHEANDLSDLLVHRKAHACTKNGTKTNTAVNVSSHYHNADTINSSKTSLSNDNSHINNDISHEQSDMEEENSNLSDESENDNTQLVEQTTDNVHQSSQFKLNYHMFTGELLWLENNPTVKAMTKIHHDNYSIEYNCKKCDFRLINDRDLFLKHLDGHENKDAFVYDLSNFSHSDISKLKYQLNTHNRSAKNGKCS